MTPEERANNIVEIIMGTKHKSSSQAIMADMFDVIPIAGDISNALRTIKEPDESKRAIQLVDTVVGALPDPFGGILDALTPTNTLNFFRGQRH